MAPRRRHSFPFGTCINTNVIQNPAFVDFFTKHFDWAVFENELKWYHTEAQQGQLNYADSDALLDFCDRYGKTVRGHCIFWAVENTVQQWVKSLDNDGLTAAVQGRLTSLLTRYAGRFPHYDVNNEIRLVCRWPAAIGEVWIAIGKGFADGNPTWPSAKSHRQTFLRQREVCRRPTVRPSAKLCRWPHQQSAKAPRQPTRRQADGGFADG